MNNGIKKIVVVGGGTSGWIVAARLAKHLKVNTNNQYSLTLVESPDIPGIGVGEGTFPTMRGTLKSLGISETDFIQQCNATFKQGIRFDHWEYSPEEKPGNGYYHLFNVPHKTEQFELTDYWLLGQGQKDKSFAHNLSNQALVCDQFLGPKKITTPEYQAMTNYAYHLDAKKFVEFLNKWSVEKLGVKHVLANLIDVNFHPSGDIASIQTKEAGVIEGDLFIDCTGFSALLIGKYLNVPFIDKSDILFVDRAIAIQVPYTDPQEDIACTTISTAHEAGWTWDIALQNRRGVGYVYSSEHTDDTRAEQVLRDYIGAESEGLSSNKFKMRVGYREKFWHKNCVAVGFAGGFLEPLESTALILVEAAANMLCDQFPHKREAMEIVANKYNGAFHYRWERIIEFVKLHYCISKRSDNQFWLDNRDASTIPEALQEKMQHWLSHPPMVYDFANIYETFTLDSYQWILYGMNYPTDLEHLSGLYTNTAAATSEFGKVQQITDASLQQLPNHRDLINKVMQFGFPKI